MRVYVMCSLCRRHKHRDEMHRVEVGMGAKWVCLRCLERECDAVAGSIIRLMDGTYIAVPASDPPKTEVS